MLDIVRAAESLALGEIAPPKSPVDHHETLQKTTTIVMSKHTLNTMDSQQQQQVQPIQVSPSPPSQVCRLIFLCFSFSTFLFHPICVTFNKRCAMPSKFCSQSFPSFFCCNIFSFIAGNLMITSSCAIRCCVEVTQVRFSFDVLKIFKWKIVEMTKNDFKIF